MEPGLSNDASYYVAARNGCWIGIQTYLFYGDVDSDDDWEEEEPGESLSDCEKKDDDDEEV